MMQCRSIRSSNRRYTLIIFLPPTIVARYKSVTHGKDTYHRLYCPRSRRGMASSTLSAGHRGQVLTEYCLQGMALTSVIVRSTSAMRVDIVYILWREMCHS